LGSGGGCLSRRVEEVMSSPPIVAGVGERLSSAARRMYEAGVGSVIVVDASGRLAGILTKTDILRLLAMGAAARDPRLGDVMTLNVITARPWEPLGAAEERMRELGIRHLPVVDEEGVPRGMLSYTDILRALLDCMKAHTGQQPPRPGA